MAQMNLFSAGIEMQMWRTDMWTQRGWEDGMNWKIALTYMYYHV